MYLHLKSFLKDVKLMFISEYKPLWRKIWFLHRVTSAVEFLYSRNLIVLLEICIYAYNGRGFPVITLFEEGLRSNSLKKKIFQLPLCREVLMLQVLAMSYFLDMPMSGLDLHINLSGVNRRCKFDCALMYQLLFLIL